MPVRFPDFVPIVNKGLNVDWGVPAGLPVPLVGVVNPSDDAFHVPAPLLKVPAPVALPDVIPAALTSHESG